MARFLALLLVAVALCASCANALKCSSCLWTVFATEKVLGDPACITVGLNVTNVPKDIDYPSSPLTCYKLVGFRDGSPSMVYRTGKTKEKMQAELLSYGFPKTYNAPVRGCSDFAYDEYRGTMCSCDMDGCNGSTKTGAVVYAVFLTIFFSVLCKQLML